MSQVYCPICGKHAKGKCLEAAPWQSQHRCDPKTLRGIDAMMKTNRLESERRRTEAYRLCEGFEMLGMK